MIKIIYKEGLEDQNRIECIEGIKIDLFNGQSALIYPKYANAVLLTKGRDEEWTARTLMQAYALKVRNSDSATNELLKIGSPAAKHVTQYNSCRYGTFALPTLVAALEIITHIREIRDLAEMIEGADQLGDFKPEIWSCVRSYRYAAWGADDYGKMAKQFLVDIPRLTIPTRILNNE